MSKVIAIFSPRDSLDAQFTKEASAIYESWKARREIELREALTSRQAWIFEVEVTAPSQKNKVHDRYFFKKKPL